MEYQDFALEIRSAGKDLFEATVIDAPLRLRPRSSFNPPLNESELQALLEAADQPTKTDLAETQILVGARLYESLFRGEVKSCFETCLSALGRDKYSGLRLRLRFSLDDSEIRYLAAVPWEWLWDPSRKVFLARESKTPVVRDYATPYFQTALEVEGPLRILIVGAAPRDLHDLKLRQEMEQMVKALGPLQAQGLVRLFKLQDATTQALRRALLDYKIHVLHFMGHGGYHEETGYGAVFFIKPDRTQDEVHGERLASLLKDVPDLRLVVLNACNTARHSRRGEAPLYSGVASAILERAGVPAVVANQHTITDKVAIELGTTFYRGLASGDGVDAALTELRLNLQAASSEWSTPILFLNAQHGKLFSVAPTATFLEVIEVDPDQMAEEPIRLGIRTFNGYGGDMEARNEKVLDRVMYFDKAQPKGRPILHQKWWQEKVFPDLQDFLEKNVNYQYPVLLDLAAHASIAFAAGWLLEAKSGVDLRVRQRINQLKELEWSATDGSAREGRPWLDRPDVYVSKDAPDVALALSVSLPLVADEVKQYILDKKLPVGRIIDATIAPEPGPQSVRGGAHALHLAQTLLPRIRQRYPHERAGELHLFCAAPNALLVYLGQLARSFGRIVLYEYMFDSETPYANYERSIVLPPWKD
ncbi:MAG TPA: SAVED domain-containing protein [Thermoanaerobaculia bacterium]|nr:SAVED domain-containing protein [Thermoanaerobaculia bacterium]